MVAACGTLGINARVAAARVPGVATCASVPTGHGKAYDHKAFYTALCNATQSSFCHVEGSGAQWASTFSSLGGMAAGSPDRKCDRSMFYTAGLSPG